MNNPLSPSRSETVRRERRSMVGRSPFALPRSCGADRQLVVLGEWHLSTLGRIDSDLAGPSIGSSPGLQDAVWRLRSGLRDATDRVARRLEPRDRDASGRGLRIIMVTGVDSAPQDQAEPNEDLQPTSGAAPRHLPSATPLHEPLCPATRRPTRAPSGSRPQDHRHGDAVLAHDQASDHVTNENAALSGTVAADLTGSID